MSDPKQFPLPGLPAHGNDVVLESWWMPGNAGNIVYLTMEGGAFNLRKATWAPAVGAYVAYEHLQTMVLRAAVEWMEEIRISGLTF